ALPALLSRLRPLWDAQVGRVARVGRSGDPDADLLDILAQDASAREVWIRQAFGAEFHRNLADFLGADVRPLATRQQAIRLDTAAVLGATLDLRALDLVFA